MNNNTTNTTIKKTQQTIPIRIKTIQSSTRKNTMSHSTLRASHQILQTLQKLFHSFQAEGTKLAEGGKYREALGKWEAALMLMPENAVLHEQKAQVLLEIGDAWNAVKAATRATELKPSWDEVRMVTLGRAQLNFGEPDSAIESFDSALAIKPDSEEARDDRHTAMQLVKRRKQLHSSGLSPTRNRYAVGEKT
ncbi:Tetratricopeptide repeat-like superfamily protein [Prunus dulcis]|uniref:Tetratricopeptide repeat-like superfamily protein n=1 Tax=Prunus dulcis TaxID=3755 RepID=A0A4Y1QUJ9_PRUDU|nr:Tetratricopeptide repeat-like superfamily protein [Prunus dulcis]